MTKYFENLTFELYVFYILNTHVKFHANQVQFSIQFINLFFIHNFILKKLKFKHLIDNIITDL